MLHDKTGERRITILPFQNAWVRASIPLVHFQKRNVIGSDMAAIGKTGLPGMCINFTGSVGSISKIDSISFEMNRPLNSPTLEIKNILLTMDARDSILSPIPVVNKYGQWTPGNPDVCTLDEELATLWVEDDGDNTAREFLDFLNLADFFKEKVKATGFSEQKE